MSKRPIVFAASVIMVICFSIAASLSAHTSPGVALAAAPGRLSLEALKNTEYSSDNATGGKAKLTDGVYREKYDANSATELVVTLTEPVAYGDLNGDGVEDAAVVLVADPGGSGTFYFLSAVLNDNGKPKSVSTVLLGDRIKLKDLAITAGAIAANIVTQGPGDPMCCPTQDETLTFKLQGGTLVEPSASASPQTNLVDEKRVGLNPEDIQLQTGKTASSFNAELEGLQPYDSESSNPHSAAPAHIKVTFDNDKLNQWFDPRDRQLLIYPVDAWQEMYKAAGDPYVDARIKKLKSLLAERPPVVDSELPVLPAVPDLEPFVTRLRYVDFPGGSGIRFLALRGPEHTPVTNDTIFYTFQGLTSDGKYYVSFFAPVSTAALRNTVREATAPGEPSLADYDAYLAEMVSRLDALTPEDFTPPPPQFDEMLKSLQLGGEAALTVDALKNAEYTSDFTANGKARLVNGDYWEPVPDSPAKVEVRLSDLMAFSDLDGDGARDAAVVLVSSGGGTGRFYDLVAMLNKDGQPVQAAGIRLGDRVQLRSMVVDGGKAVIEMVTQGPGDGACCPTLKVRNTYAFENSTWKELSSEEQGSVSLSDLEGVTWQLSELNKGQSLVEGTEITATFANGKISGSAGCNNYSAALTPGERTAVTVGPAVSTRKACPELVMAQEAEYLSALQSVTQWGFDDGYLSLVSVGTDNNPRWLNFTPAQPAGPAVPAAVTPTEQPAQPTAAPTVEAAPAAIKSDAWQPVACDAFGVTPNIAKIADCGYVTVPENRAAGTDKTIQLAVVRVRSTGQNPGAPVLLGTGGPGSNGLAKASDAAFTQTHADILADRDWVFFSQRGTLHARPELVCPDYNLVPFEAAQKGWTDEQKQARNVETMKACLDASKTQGVDLTGYNTVENAADIVDITRALGYKTIIYYGQSYGTLLGQFLLRSHPELLEAIILDGIAPATVKRWTDVTDYPAAFRRVFAACAQDAACAAKYPDPEGALAKAMAALTANPPELTMPLGDGKQMTLKADETLAMNALFLNLYAPGGYGKVPRIAYQMSNGDFSPLNATLRLLFANSDTARVMHFAMACSDDPTVSLDELNLKGVPEFYANLIVDDGATYTTNCPMFKLPQLPASSDELVVSKVPALLLQGGLDPATPVSGGNTLQDGLSNSFNVIVPAGSHIQGGSPCALKIMDAFMSNPRAKPDTSCIDPAIPFAVPGPVSVKSDDGGATLTITLPEGFGAIQGTGAWAGDDMNVALLVFKAGSTAEDVLADLLATVPLQNVEKTDGPVIAGYPSRIVKGEITVAGFPHNVQAFAFADKTRAYRIVFDVTNPAKVDEIVQTTLPAMLKSATVGGK